MSRDFGVIARVEHEYELPIEKHTADSKWQYCKCKSCQDKRAFILAAPGGKNFDFNAFRHRDEKY